MADILHKQLSYHVVGCAQRVHAALGPGFPEAVYHKALCCELMKAEIPFESEKQSEVFYAGVLCGQFRMDIVVDDRIILELKALSYLKATGLKLAILINFGTQRLETQRVLH